MHAYGRECVCVCVCKLNCSCNCELHDDFFSSSVRFHLTLNVIWTIDVKIHNLILHNFRGHRIFFVQRHTTLPLEYNFWFYQKLVAINEKQFLFDKYFEMLLRSFQNDRWSACFATYALRGIISISAKTPTMSPIFMLLYLIQKGQHTNSVWLIKITLQFDSYVIQRLKSIANWCFLWLNDEIKQKKIYIFKHATANDNEKQLSRFINENHSKLSKSDSHQ